MSKKEFLEKLEKRLNILEEDEINDIINEYKDIIEEKIKHGKKEEDAVSDFGDFDELVKEILKAYKINPKNSKDKAKDFLDAGEELIKDGAKKLTDSADKLIKNISKEDTASTITNLFEILLKALCVLIILAILTVPFKIIFGIGNGIFNSMFGFGRLFEVLFNLLGILLFFVIAILLMYFLFKDNINKNNIKIEDKDKKIKNSEKIKEEKKVNNQTSTFSNIILILLKLFIIFVFIIPLWFVIIMGFVFLAILLYFLISGLNVIGVMLLVVGGLIFLIEFSSLLYNGLFKGAKVHVFSLIIALIFIVVGTIMTIQFVTGINYIDKAPKMRNDTKEYIYNINEPTEFDVDDGQSVIEIDNSLNDGEVKIEVNYVYDYVTVNKFEHTNEEGYKEIIFYSKNIMNGKKVYDMIIDNLKNNKFYDYEKLSDINVKIRCNDKTKSLVILDN